MSTERPPPSDPSGPRRRRTAEEAREAILDVAERQLVVSGPGGIRLQEVAAEVGVSHPTVLHHFGSREGLIDAVVARVLDSLHEGLLSAVLESRQGPDQIEELLGRVFEAMLTRGRGRALLWLALSGHAQSIDPMRIRALSEAVHEVRRARRAELRAESGGKRKTRMPPLEDTYFTVLMPALAMLAMSVLGRPEGEPGAKEEAAEARRFRGWLARLIHAHLMDE